MPRLSADHLRELGTRLFTAAGCAPEDAAAVSEHLVESSLFGHDSHGTIRFYEYLQRIREGAFRTDAQPFVVQETPSTAVVDGGSALGQIAGRFATEIAIRKAREHGVAAVTLRDCSHIGRVGAYPLMAARAGMLGLAFVNAGRLGCQIAPFGGIDGRLSTNPIAFAAPRRDADPIMLDMTTSVVAEGKIRLAINRGKSVPEGWIIDHDGNPTTDPNAFKDDPPGAILPLGGSAGAHKGFGLGVMVDILAGTLTGAGCSSAQRVFRTNALLLTVYHLEHFTDLQSYHDEVEALIAHVRGSRPAPGFTEILLPGEPEFRTRRLREAEGIDVDETTWDYIRKEGRLLGVEVE
jgi:uncharacterized oxidoreductase